MVLTFQSVPVVKISRDIETKKCPDFSFEPGNVKPLEQRRERAPDNRHGHTARAGQGGPRELDLGDMGEITRQQRESGEKREHSPLPSVLQQTGRSFYATFYVLHKETQPTVTFEDSNSKKSGSVRKIIHNTHNKRQYIISCFWNIFKEQGKPSYCVAWGAPGWISWFLQIHYSLESQSMYTIVHLIRIK